MAVNPAVAISPRIGYGREEWTKRFVSELHQLPIVMAICLSEDKSLIDELHRIVFLSFKKQELTKSKEDPEAIGFWDTNLSHIEQWRI